MSGPPIQKNGIKDGTADCRGPRGSRSSASGLVDNPAQVARWRAIAERMIEKYSVFSPVIILFDSNQIQIEKDVMKSLGMQCPDPVLFRSAYNDFISQLPPEERLNFVKPFIFQIMHIHGKSLSASELLECLETLHSLGLNDKQKENAIKDFSEHWIANGNPPINVSADLVPTDANGNTLSSASYGIVATAQSSIPNQQNQSIEFENERYNRKADDNGPSIVIHSSSSESIARDTISGGTDFTRFVMVREAQAKSSGPAAHELTTLERSALSLDRKQDSNESARISDQGKQSALSDSAKPNEYMIDLQSKDPIERLKFFFANMLGIQPSNELDDKGGSDTFPKGPPSCPQIRAPSIAVVEGQKPQEKTIRAAVVLQPMEPLTFRLRQGRFVTASSLALTPPALSQDKTVSPVAGKDSQKSAEKIGGPQIDPKKTSPVSVMPASTPKKKKADAGSIESKMVAKQKAETKKKDIRKKASELEREKKERRKGAESAIIKSRATGRVKSAHGAGQTTARGGKGRRGELSLEQAKKRLESVPATARKPEGSKNTGISFSKKGAGARSIPIQIARPDKKRSANKKRTTISLVTSDKKPRKKPSHR